LGAKWVSITLNLFISTPYSKPKITSIFNPHMLIALYHRPARSKFHHLHLVFSGEVSSGNTASLMFCVKPRPLRHKTFEVLQYPVVTLCDQVACSLTERWGF
jgi:hypothetical protein